MMRNIELTANQIMIEKVQAGSVDGYKKNSQSFYNHQSVKSASKVADNSVFNPLESFINSNDDTWLKKPIGRLQYFGWMYLVSIIDVVVEKAFEQSTNLIEWSLLMVIVVASVLFSFVIIRKREIDITEHFNMTWRALLYIISIGLIFISGFLDGSTDSLNSGTHVAQVELIGRMIFLAAGLSLLFQPGYLWTEKKKRKK